MVDLEEFALRLYDKASTISEYFYQLASFEKFSPEIIKDYSIENDCKDLLSLIDKVEFKYFLGYTVDLTYIFELKTEILKLETLREKELSSEDFKLWWNKLQRHREYYKIKAREYRLKHKEQVKANELKLNPVRIDLGESISFDSLPERVRQRFNANFKEDENLNIALQPEDMIIKPNAKILLLKYEPVSFGEFVKKTKCDLGEALSSLLEFANSRKCIVSQGTVYDDIKIAWN